MAEDSIQSAINEFYKLKTKYEEEHNKIKKKIMNNPSLSWKEKRSEYQQMKPKCIQCKRPGGTIFSTKYYEDTDKDDSWKEYRQLKAICGVIVEPCSLNITINVGKYNSLRSILDEYEKEIAEIKKNIIEYKNQLLFGYVTAEKAVNQFNDLKSLLSDYTSYAQMFTEQYYHVVDNSEHKRALKENIEQSYMVIEEMKKNMSLFNETTNVQFVRDVVSTYENTLKPLLEKIMKLKYRENFVWYNEDTNTYHLIQHKNSASDKEFNEGDEKIVSYQFGVDEFRKKRNIEQPTSQVEKTPQEQSVQEQTAQNKQALKSKKKKLLIVEPTNAPVPVPVPAPAPAENTIASVITSLFSGGEGPNAAAEKIWESFRPNLKEALLKDKEWMQVFMEHCIERQKQGQPCEFVPPTNLIVPPQILEDGAYDFGNEAYNRYFNALEKSQQQALLQLFTLNDGVKNYDMLEEHLANEMSILFGMYSPN
jgi:hypothetical protein